MTKVRKHSNLIGTKIGRLTVISFALTPPSSYYKFLCKCQCGNVKEIRIFEIVNKRTLSCGCLQKEKATKHGCSAHPLWVVYTNMKCRCYKETHCGYKDYGGRGIFVCSEWEDSYMTFFDWCIKNGWSRGLQLDRIDNNGYYGPDNCRFVTPKQNANNRRNTKYLTFREEKLTVSEWAAITGISYNVIMSRTYAGWSTDQILFTPLPSRK